ncbi:MAG: ATP-binding cassette domain-containing protein [Candidatus Thermoplasmatota archaeon]|nr:ATP-binding cassette domain-containing protein [Candidatus Thermoplasmatota archaeon]
MRDGLKKKRVKCPKCQHQSEVMGTPGEKKIVTCTHCGMKGYVQFKSLQKEPSESSPTQASIHPTYTTAIQVNNLTKKYKDVTAVDNITFSVKTGEIFGFLGPNGAGKTTTIRTLLGFLKPNNGNAFVCGLNIADHIIDIRKKVGYIPGELSLYEHLTGRQCLQYFSNIRNTDLLLLSELQEIFELPLDRKIKTYSRGMKQKLGIIQAFMDDPEIVIMDEPTSGLDPLLQQKFYRFLQNEKKKGRTMFFSSHILSEVEKTCDRVAIIRKGKLVTLEKIENLKKKKGKKIRLKIKGSPEKVTSFPNAKIDNGWIEFVTEDHIDEVIKKIAKYTVVDLEIQEFSLEDIFMRYYDEEQGA